MTRRWAAVLAVVAGASALVGCSVSPQPEPPSIDISHIEFGSGSAFDLVGRPGAVTPGGADLVGVNLDDASPEVTVHVDPNGGFKMSLGGAITSVVRLQAFVEELHSSPVDVTGVIAFKQGSQVLPANEPLADCFHLVPDLDLGVAPGGSETVRLTNGCSGDVRIDALTLRRGTAAWSVDQPTPFVVKKGGSSSFTVSLASSATANANDVLLVEIGMPITGTRALTLLVVP